MFNRAYCMAVRAALTDDGRPPLAAPGLKLQERLAKIEASLGRVQVEAERWPRGLRSLRSLLRRGLEQTAALWPPVRAAYQWVHRVARLLEDRQQRSAKDVRQRLSRLRGRIRGAASQAKDPAVREQLQQFEKVTKSWWPGLFHCYTTSGIPRTNNDLEHLFGSHRYHERRASGRKVASPGLVVQGISARGGEPGHATAPGGRPEIADRIRGRLAAAASRIRQTSGEPPQAAPLPPRPREVPQTP